MTHAYATTNRDAGARGRGDARPRPAPEARRPVPAVPAPGRGGEPTRAAVARAIASASRPVTPSHRADAERWTGRDLSDVRLHTGPQVRVAARALGAAAFTVGRDVGVATGPGQEIPPALLTHELVHAAQQAAEPNGATAQQAEAQAAGRGGVPGPLAAPGAPYLACAPEDWLQTTPDVRAYGYSELVDELRGVTEWLGRQISSSQDVDRMQEAKAALEAELARRQRAIRQADRPSQRRQRGGARGGNRGGTRGSPAPPTAATEAPPEDEVPRVLRDRASTQLTDPAEVRAEVDRITAWLQRLDVSRADRAALRAELAALAPQLGEDLARSSAIRQSARLTAAFQPTDAGDRTQVLDAIRLVESIRPYSAQPGTAYVVHRGELLVFPQDLADRVRGEVVAALGEAARRAGDMNTSTEFRLQEHLRLNYEQQPVVGFVVSMVSGEEPVDVQRRVLPPLGDSSVALSRYRSAQRRGFLSEAAEAVFAAVEQADRAQQLVLEGIDRSIAAAGQVVRGLEITRNLAFTVALSIGAILAAPVVAAGVAGFGATGLTATGLTALGTGTVVGAEGFGLGFLSGGAGELAAGGSVRHALRTGAREGVRVGEQGFAIGLGGGASLGLAGNLGVGTAGLSRTGTLVRSALAQGGGNALGSATGALLSEPQPGGPGRGEAALRAGVLGFGLGSLGGGAGAYASGLTSPAARLAIGAGLPSLATGGATYWQTGDWRQSLVTGGTALTVGAIGLRAPQTEPTPAQERAFQVGASARESVGSFGTGVARTVRPWLAASMIGLSEAVPATRMPVGSAPVATAPVPTAPVTTAPVPTAPVTTAPVTAATPTTPATPPATTTAPAPPTAAAPAPAPAPAAAVRVSAGALVPGGQTVVDPFSGQALGTQSASARTARSLITGIRADEGEVAAWRLALARGEIGLQAPAGANVRGPDFLTAVIDGNGVVWLIVTDVKTSTVGTFPTPATSVPPTWMAELQAAIAVGRLNLNDPALEAAIRLAFAQGRVRIRQLNADYSPTGGGTVTGF